MEGVYDELDPVRIESQQREVERRNRWLATLKTQADADAKALARNANFVRWLYTVLERSGIYSSPCHAQSGSQYYDAGRRALGLEILDDLVKHDPSILIAVMSERLKFQEAFDEQAK